MFFHVEQIHAPEDCPYGRGGSRSLHDATVKDVKAVGIYGAFMEHTIYMILEANDINMLNRFLLPGMKVCKTKITPVSDHAMPLWTAQQT
jgi:hypothetical protein